MIVLGIDPGSITTGWALLEAKGNKATYLKSGVLKYDQKKPFLDRLSEIKTQFSELIENVEPDEISLESLIFVKSPTALIKLAQTRGVILSCLVDRYHQRIFEYSPNLVKSTAVGHGHADKDSVKRFLDVVLGKRDYQTHDESDAVAIALCHILNKGNGAMTAKSKGPRSLKNSLAHKVGSL